MYSVKIKKMFYITGVIVIACVLASSLIEPMTTPSDTVRTANNGVYTEDDGRIYILTCKNDRLVAYIKGNDTPFIETTTAISSLPYDVQMRLREGIEFTQEKELRAVIDEYTS